MPKPRHKLSDMEIDEVSLVDKGANQHAMVTIAKRANEEDEMPDLFFEDGSAVDEDALQVGDIVYDGEGNAYEFTDEVEEQEKEPEPVGKSAFFDQRKQPVKKSGEKSFSEQIREELSKAFSDDDRDQVLSKAFDRIDAMQAQMDEQAEIAKSERDLRLTREYVSKAAEYNVPVDPNELGPVLYRMAESMSYEDCAVIAKCLEASGEIFTEIGYQGGGDNNDVMSMVEQKAQEVSKSGTADYQSVTDVFDANPQAYDEYLASRGF